MKLDFNEKSHLSVIICIYLLVIMAVILAFPLGAKGTILPIVVVSIFIQILIHLLSRRKK